MFKNITDMDAGIIHFLTKILTKEIKKRSPESDIGAKIIVDFHSPSNYIAPISHRRGVVCEYINFMPMVEISSVGSKVITWRHWGVGCLVIEFWSYKTHRIRTTGDNNASSIKPITHQAANDIKMYTVVLTQSYLWVQCFSIQRS